MLNERIRNSCVKFAKPHLLVGEFHDQGDTKWIVIRGQLRGHNDASFGRPITGRPIGRQVVGCLQGVFGSISCYQLVILFFNIVPLIMEFMVIVCFVI
jgi:hypothetical protein